MENFEAKYNAALERAKKELQACGSQDCDAARRIFRIFPELQESEDEDERIRKALKQGFSQYGNSFTTFGGIKVEDILAWLEKQSEQIHSNSENVGMNEESKWTDEDEETMQHCCDAIAAAHYYTMKDKKEMENWLISLKQRMEAKWNIPFDYENTNIQQKNFALKVEPKFRPGDWIVDKSGLAQQVLDFRGGIYTCTYNSFTTDCESNYCLWTIQDARDGDVLEFEDHKRVVVGIVSYVNKRTGKVDVSCLLKDNEFKIGIFYALSTINPHPATKEQHDLLFQKMKEAGYKWDDENKILKRMIKQKKLDANQIEKQEAQKPASKVEPKFHPGDWIVFNGWVLHINEIVNGYYITESIGGIPCSYDWAIDNIARLWTIQDAKDGDVLMTTQTRNCPFIYRKTNYNNHLAYYYAGVNGNGDFCDGCLKRTMYHFGSVANIIPVTKEQRDLLFEAMKQAGYEWNSEKKELKKIESKKLDADKVIEWIYKY